jgi:tetratricopeptide (TPR) repeat protein
MTHYDDEALIRYELMLEEDRETIVHLEECPECRARLAELRKVDAQLRAAETWLQSHYSIDPVTLAELTEFEAQIEAENRAAERLLAPLLNAALRFRTTDLVGNPKARTAGVVKYLCQAANRLHEKRPLFSLEVATTALEIARVLPAGARLPRYHTGLALRERANALRYLGRFREALVMLEHAEGLFDEDPGGDPFEIAIVWYIRAVVLIEMGRIADAQRLAARAAAVFRRYGNGPRERAARLVNASCLAFSGQFGEAARAFETIVAKAKVAGEQSMIARAANGAANAYLELGHLDTAERYYTEAFLIYDELGLATEKTRVEWSLALTLVRRGELEAGATRLDVVRVDLGGLGLRNDHALATLDWAAARLACDQPAGVAEACKEIVVRFESEEMMRNARLALAYVHEALARGTATPALLQHVRDYLDLLPDRPTVPFVPLQ